ncbi:hypothetical protein SAMN05216456_0600 [Devosia crocina]|uniref:Uncharacterized protein n=1 Tax=Devosia crocina TaxID=429728 RepID=A0A1I7N2E2_9HYPH|nr:hypothetical protein [Devosia crocina]SFV28793.1 hypothetical protein SAMN05216456_0600 [Devosia crocina]
MSIVLIFLGILALAVVASAGLILSAEGVGNPIASAETGLAETTGKPTV